MQRYIFLSLRTILLSLILGLLASCQQSEELAQLNTISNREQVALTIQSDRLLPQVVKSRAADTKNNAETDINHLYLFFFDQGGNYLENVTDRFSSFMETSDLTVKIDKQAVQSVGKDQKVQIYVLANMDRYGLFDGEEDEFGRPVLNGSGNSTDLIVLQSKLLKINDLQSIQMQIPGGGMPMAKLEQLDFYDENLAKGVPIALSALMARVDFNIQLQADHSNGNYPSYYLEQYTVGNAPKGIHIGENISSVTDVTNVGGKENVIIPNRKLIYNDNGEISFTFYMFQNIQNPKTASGTYPENQMFKPMIASEDAAYVELKGIYTTADKIQYYVTHRLYLGANHTNDFTIKSNYQYKNDIVIKGLTNHNVTDEDEDEYLTLDTRVNIHEDSQFYISILNEKKLDAHFAVVPMDVYFLGKYSTNGSKLVVTLGADTDSCYYENNSGVMTQYSEPWIRMEKIPSENMNNGNLGSGMTEYTHVRKAGSYQAYHGIRKFFTETLVTGTLNETGKEVVIDASRDRIYFYIDENLGENERIGTITLKFYADGNTSGEPTRTEVMEFRQLPLLEVVSKDVSIWIEQVEEYIDSYDPLEEYSNNNIFNGLKWGFLNHTISNVSGCGNSYENYYYGQQYTTALMEDEAGEYTTESYEMRNLTLSEKPKCAAQYCYNRNKRYGADGTVRKSETYTDVKWFLPGITQMEDAIKTYYNVFTEFQGNFYWSSSAGKQYKPGFLGFIGTEEKQTTTYARATMSDGNGGYLNSEYKAASYNADYEAQPGCINRDMNQKEYDGKTRDVRIRAFRIDRKKR